MVNKLFEEEVRRVVKDKPYRRLEQTSAYQSALAEFDGHIKPGFRGPNDPNRYVSFPMAGLRTNKAAGLVSNSMALSGYVYPTVFITMWEYFYVLIQKRQSDRGSNF